MSGEPFKEKETSKKELLSLSADLLRRLSRHQQQNLGQDLVFDVLAPFYTLTEEVDLPGLIHGISQGLLHAAVFFRLQETHSPKVLTEILPKVGYETTLRPLETAIDEAVENLHQQIQAWQEEKHEQGNSTDSGAAGEGGPTEGVSA